jgi:hypothetical protein
VVQILQKQVALLQDPQVVASQDDPDRQPRFCEWSYRILQEDPDKIIFKDEANFVTGKAGGIITVSHLFFN